MNRTQDWLEQAKHDLTHARQSIGLEHFAWACFAAQQAAEKAVKAFHLATTCAPMRNRPSLRRRR